MPLFQKLEFIGSYNMGFKAVYTFLGSTPFGNKDKKFKTYEIYGGILSFLGSIPLRNKDKKFKTYETKARMRHLVRQGR